MNSRMYRVETIEKRESQYFLFEQDFVEKGVRCIPMIVRLKMDAVGIKLKLAHWSRFPLTDRVELSVRECRSEADRTAYRDYLAGLIKRHTGEEAVPLTIDMHPAWRRLDEVPAELQEKAREFGWFITIAQWKGLMDLQRFALLKLCRPGHENKNFPKAMKEFRITPDRPVN